MLVVGLIGHFRCHDDLVRPIHHRLRVVRVVEPLVGLLHDLRFGVREVRLRLVFRCRVDGCRLLASTLAALGFAPRLLFVTTALFFLRLDTGLRFQTTFRLANLQQSVFAPLQFRRQFVAAPASQRGILLGVGLFGLLQQLLDFRFQPREFLVHVAETHRLVPRSVRAHLGAVGGQVAELDHAHLAGQTQHFEEQRPKRRLVDLAEIAEGAEVRGVITDDGSEGEVALAGGRDLPTGADADGVGVDQERDHESDIEGGLAAQLPRVMPVEG